MMMVSGDVICYMMYDADRCCVLFDMQVVYFMFYVACCRVSDVVCCCVLYVVVCCMLLKICMWYAVVCCGVPLHVDA